MDNCKYCMDGDCSSCLANEPLPTDANMKGQELMSNSDIRQYQSLKRFFSKGGDPYDHGNS